MTKPIYGGQAVPEGVMFQSKTHMSTAIRRTNGDIDYFDMPRPEKPFLTRLKKIPLIRGNVAILEASVYGMKHMDFAADRYDRDPAEDYKIEQEKNNQNTAKVVLSTVIIGILTFFIGKFILTLIPVFVAEVFSGIITGKLGQVALETLIKLIILLGYIYILSLTPMVKRLFQYHGAEHKVINCFEQDKPLTIENVQAESRLHYRCGSSFILFTVLVGFAVYMFVPVDPLYVRVLNRILLIPVVLGLSFEVLQITNKLREVPVLKYFGLPGLWLQYLTTKQPDNDQVEVAIHSFNHLLGSDKK
ncbi:hypothetical protein GCM10007275_04460 [Jeotgalicoccus coquinae]|uniref:Uncharacterized protein YqhQ n=1 Tax=Jeotgalicoccus coquinae TaxID=709509 RepID=A0A6V7R8Z7_9STAP|nr:DUF1385 domain-containing protein [Jeotgalicoccus coquinae]MBB6422887.1 uncharacterized protein YqhQ [Jeotgalicoccus coquinae]GGE12360.1 hypothetical protein GCM10007275_04460 [Jeotgalicoccus coquinae]CAD2073756.1 hypothetical protein JEOCOQ751_00793 [Jeotgalicoccus coquinae]